MKGGGSECRFGMNVLVGELLLMIGIDVDYIVLYPPYYIIL